MTDTGFEPALNDPARVAGKPALVGAEDHCIFECGGRAFATSLNAVREVLSGKLATPVPQAPPALVGVVEFHGDVLPVVQPSTLLGIAARPYTPADPIVVLSSRDIKIGLAVDRVRHVRAIDPTALTAATHECYRGWWAGSAPPVAVLDVEALVSRAVRIVAAQLQGGPTGNSGRNAGPCGSS
ncbi:MAG TPA: chemotaxis protein CheW [Candidatus Margulisiibacteriota bacterium]|nr:chemotaxis protein CheW [Candidatus Margulisiibacteriota bacterium]